ncbi:MAG: hypothetical protein U9O89_06185 [Thermoproteota archaeon]|nr:hypothetical protein [Thermoproteota archaeon]
MKDRKRRAKDPPTLPENFIYVPQSLKTRLQNKAGTSLKTQKYIFNHL